MLHIVKSQQAIPEVLRYAQSSDAILLVEDAVYLANPKHHLYDCILRHNEVVVLSPDSRARGISDLISHQIIQVDYLGFVELTERFQQSLTWD